MTPEQDWTPVFDLAELPVGHSRLVKHGLLRIAVFRTSETGLHAVDNACPHEGYPLLGGPVRDCVVTCPWHNYKFDLRDGRCVKGEEDLRTWPARIVGGGVELDLAEPPLAERIATIRRSLEDGTWRGNLGQVARDLVRWLELGGRPLDLALHCAHIDARYAENGTSHALPVAFDAVGLAAGLEGSDRALPLLHAYDMAAETIRRMPVRETPAPAQVVGRDPDDLGRELEDLVEAEREDEAEALLRGALRAGIAPSTVERWLLRLCARHFLGFGHPLIYLPKAMDLLVEADAATSAEVLSALLLRIVRATRESLLPDWSRARMALAGWEPRIAELWTGLGRTPDFDLEPLREALCDGEADEVQDRLGEALAAGAPLAGILDALTVAAWERLRRFDPAIELRIDLQDGWLDATHRATFVEGVRTAAHRVPDPAILRLLWQAAHWVAAARPLDRAEPVASDPAPDSAATPSRLDPLLTAIAAHDGDRAEAALAAFLREDGDLGRLRGELVGLVLGSVAVRPIVNAHLIKTLVAAFAEAGRLPPAERALPLAALVRFLAGPVVETSLPRRLHEAVGFVLEGRVPDTLS